MVNEFNYIHEFFTQIRDKILIEKTGTYNWASLFTLYDTNKDNLFDKIELKQMLKDSGFSDVTDAEVGFTFNIMANF